MQVLFAPLRELSLAVLMLEGAYHLDPQLIKYLRKCFPKHMFKCVKRNLENSVYTQILSIKCVVKLKQVGFSEHTYKCNLCTACIQLVG